MRSAIDDLGGTAILSNVSVAGSGGTGGNEYIVSPLIVALQNPSSIALHTVDIALSVIFNKVQLGYAVIRVSFRLLSNLVELTITSAIRSATRSQYSSHRIPLSTPGCERHSGAGNMICASCHWSSITLYQDFLSSFIQGNEPIPLTIKGDTASTPMTSLQPALQGLHLSTSLAGKLM